MELCYAIKDWDKHFENSESRKVKSLTWVPVKNKHDGKGYRRVVAHPKSVQVFCAWNLIVQVASRTPRRGVLRDEDGPLTTSDLAFKTGFPESIFEVAFQVLTEPKIGWLVRSPSDDIPEAPEVSGDAGVEQNRTEGNRMEGHDRLTSLKMPSGKEGGCGGEGTAAADDTDLVCNAARDRLAADIVNNRSGWHYDNCKLAPGDLIAASLRTVLRDFIGMVTEAQVAEAWREAAKRTHQAVVDGMAIKTSRGAYAVGIFKEELRRQRGTP